MDGLIQEIDLILDIPHSSGMSIPELLGLSNFISKIRPKRILEIGTKYGSTTINMAKFSTEDCKIISVDLVPLDYSIVQKYPQSSKITFLQGDSLVFDFKKLGSFDMVLVDANHEYKFVQNDTYAAFSVVKPTGYVLWHDYGKSESQYIMIQVKRALTDLNIIPDILLAESLIGMRR